MSLCQKAWFRVVVSLGVGTLAWTVSSGGIEHFVRREGNRLFEGVREYRFLGANMPGVVLPYDFTLRLPERMRLPTPWEQEDALRTLAQMNLKVVRTWNLPIRAPNEPTQCWHYVLGPGQFQESAFHTLDHLLDAAHRFHIRVIVCFTAEFGDYLGGIGTYAAHRGRPRMTFYTDEQIKEDYRATVRHVILRTNTVNGRVYRDDPAILAWQFGNEMDSAPDAWLSEMAAFIKSLDPNHLVAETRHRPGRAMYVDPHIDLVTRHLYASYRLPSTDWVEVIRRELDTIGRQRPLFIGEFGPYVDGRQFTQEGAARKVQEFLEGWRSLEGVAGALLWSMYFHREEGGFWWHQIFTFPAVMSYRWPGFNSGEEFAERGILRELRAAAFRWDGRPEPPQPPPEPAPRLHAVPAGEPWLTWSGSTGASGYDIERAEHPSGPWVRIAEHVSDGDVAYRPLWSDFSAQIGRTYWYRVIGRNEQGRTEPSNVVGPVVVQRRVLVDEMADFQRMSARSQGLKLSNAYNALYAEYPFRAVGQTNEWAEWEWDAAQLDEVRLVAFFSGAPSEPEVWAMGSNGPIRVHLTATEQTLPPPPGGAAAGQRRTMVTYHARPGIPATRGKIVWTTAMELDRVEWYVR
jgi:hypothetical protein